MDDSELANHEHHYREGNPLLLYNERRSCPVYAPLDESKREFRVLQVRARIGSALHVQLKTVSLDEKPDYIAASYCWGNNGEKLPICVNQYMFGITDNLYELLMKLCETSRKHWLIFADALCIDQSSEEERSSQMKLMGDIYSDAREVIAWLGGRELVGELPEVIQAWEDVAQDRVESYSQPWKSYTYLKVTSGVTSSPYWKRLWIVQELVLAKSIVVLSGDGELDMGTYEKAILGIFKTTNYDVSREFDSPGDGMDIVNNFMGFMNVAQPWKVLENRRRIRRLQRHTIPLYKLITVFGGQESSEPRDMVFGLLGMADTHIQADIKISLTELYQRVLVEALSHILDSCAADDPKRDREKIISAMSGFWTYYLRALEFSNFNLAVHFTARYAMERICNQKHEIFPPVWEACLSTSAVVKLGGWPWMQVILDTHNVLMGLGYYLLPRGVMDGLCQRRIRYNLQCRLLRIAQYFDAVLAMPDGELRTCQELMATIDALIESRQDKKPVMLQAYSDQFTQPWHKWTAVCGRLCDLIFISLSSVALTYVGATLADRIDPQLASLAITLDLDKNPAYSWTLWILSSSLDANGMLATIFILAIVIPMMGFRFGFFDGIAWYVTGIDLRKVREILSF